MLCVFDLSTIFAWWKVGYEQIIVYIVIIYNIKTTVPILDYKLT